MGFIKDILSPPKARAPEPIVPEKPISPVTNRATQEGIIRKRKRSLATQGSGGGSLLNEKTVPLGT